MINNREQFKKYILTALGAPVISVDVNDEQIEDRIDEALDFWHQYHYDGSMRLFLKQLVTPSFLTVTNQNVEQFNHGVKVRGKTSKAEADVVCVERKGIRPVGNKIPIYQVKGTFMQGEIIEVGTTNDFKPYQLINSSSCFDIGIYDDKRIKVPDWVLGVIKILPANTATSSQSLFDAQYQLRLNDMYDLTSTSLIYYEQAMQHLDLLNYELSANPSFEFNRHEGYIYPNCKWGVDFCVGDYMIIEAFRALSPAIAGKLWNDMWLKKYAIALVKRQWGQNLRKYSGIQLPGGVTFNGVEILQEAQQEISTLEEQIVALAPPSAFFIG